MNMRQIFDRHNVPANLRSVIESMVKDGKRPDPECRRLLNGKFKGVIDEILDLLSAPIYGEYVFPAAMTPAEREVVELIDAGHCLESAAETLDMPVETAAWRLRKAKKNYS
jgi:hypothetical protein